MAVSDLTFLLTQHSWALNVKRLRFLHAYQYNLENEMYFDRDFISGLPDDPRKALEAICSEYFDITSNIVTDYPLEPDDYLPYKDVAYEAYSIVTGFIHALGDPTLKRAFPKLSGNSDEDTRVIHETMAKLKDSVDMDLSLERAKGFQTIFEQKFGLSSFCYEFSGGDLQQIQRLINELRDLISASDELEEKHKQRVLSRLEKLQSEMHKKVSDLDRVYGNVIELSIMARRVGENFKPVVDRIRELVAIVWPTQARTFDLPSDTPFELPGRSENDKS